MKLVKTRWPHYWIEIPADLTFADLEQWLRGFGANWKLRWNHKLGAIEFYTTQ